MLLAHTWPVCIGKQTHQNMPYISVISAASATEIRHIIYMEQFLRPILVKRLTIRWIEPYLEY